ncbi:hypothetical protein LWI29_026833 [Acer saccharum]|uniref:Leucine-rich repeat-containing N-terminal plant-type domain-containing protein n=1 Tax=Acer saccharum TaxID=4024 RepID=A0AA39VRK7_ACESA|nr:hypothetical protein LWI29_026833 [Acer saccharum]
MSVIYLVFLELLAIAAINISFCNRSTPVGCIESERLALLRFKQDHKDPSNRLASWNGDGDCCTWDGVVCHNFTGHVLELHLRNPNWEFCTFQDNQGLHIQYDSRHEHDQYDSYKKSLLEGKLNPSLLDLKHLIYFGLER